ncbi:hypothetical protein HNR72_005413 [Streptomyces collinus]|uniref:Uncharacterized protein n=1 Tax=Streptomyces collinus TaxID=42684 RepID=A0AA89QEM4_STRCU|nr:hypothetical protein [Streptomyces collinus]
MVAPWWDSRGGALVTGREGDSGATALGGKPTDPGAPVTDEAIANGTIPAKNGGFQPPAVRIG